VNRSPARAVQTCPTKPSTLSHLNRVASETEPLVPGTVRRSIARRVGLLVPLLAALVVPLASARPSATLARVDHIADGDTLTLTNKRRVRLVQIDTPEVYFHPECYGRRASRIAKRMLPPGTLVRLSPEAATDRVDRYRRLLRYVVRARDGVDVNVQLVRVGAAAPYFYGGRRGRYSRLLDRLARRARARHLGLWGACPGTPYRPDRAVQTGPVR
jgi:endonuclease YncB( thermonuclease family)